MPLHTVIVTTRRAGAIAAVVINRGPGGGAAVISSLTPPANLNAIWFNPAFGTYATYNGSVWVTGSTLPLISVIPLTGLTLAGEPLTLAGEILTLG